MYKKSLWRKNTVPPNEKFLFLVVSKNTIMLQHLIIHYSLYHRSTGCLVRKLKTKENFKLIALKVVVVAYERWSLIRGFKYSDLTWKLLVF